MSKMDGLRAMREARYEANQPKGAKKKAVKAEPVQELCGHKNMGGRSCTREADHSAKSHRYS